MKESDIRPDGLLDKYLALSKEDAKLFFSEGLRRDIDCIACGSCNVLHAFSKHNFGFSVCSDCGTLYQTPRPELSAFERFYRDSNSSNYWAEVFFPAVAESRREKIFRYRAKQLKNKFDSFGFEITNLIDVGAGYGIFLEEWQKISPASRLIAVEPSRSLAKECRNRGLEVVEEIAEEVEGYDESADLVVCFEVLEHIHNPLDFMTRLKRLVRPGGYVFVSTLCIDGFDLQQLWDQSNQISPPHHINFFSISGFSQLFARSGLVNIEITTPGKLDVEIVRKAVIQNPKLLKKNCFIKKIINNEQVSSNFQNFLSENCLSSHAWIFGQVPNR